jgi:hypothetical protein
MFRDGSRYARTPTDTVDTANGRRVTAIRLRRLGTPPADPTSVVEGDRLDLLAHRYHSDGTRCWHVADANSALDARTLVSRVAGTIRIPRA